MIATSPDGQWAAVRRGREVALHAGGAGPATSRIEIESDEADLTIIGPPSVLAVVTRVAGDGAGSNAMVLYQPPYLEAVARLDLEGPMRIAAVTGPRVVLVSPDGKAVTVVRIAGRALSAQALETGSPVEFAVGLERNQVLFSLMRKLEAWDAVSGRPLLRMQLPLPPPPRAVGPAQGHLWAIRPGGEDILVCRLSDGRPFQHHAGAPIDEVICHPASPVVMLVTRRGLVRLHCFAHALTPIDAPWRPGVALGQLVVGPDVSLLGASDDDDEPWRVPIAGAGAPPLALDAEPPPGEPGGIERVRGVRDRIFDLGAGGSGAERTPLIISPASPAPASPAPPASAHDAPERRVLAPPRAFEPARSRAWREPLAAFGGELARGAEAEVPVVAADTEIAQLAQRLALPATARRALVALYGLYLVGEPGVAIARLAYALGDWTEALGQGELGSLAMLRRRGGKVALRGSVTDLLDGGAPRAIRLVGAAAARSQPGATRLPRGGKADQEIETELASQLGRIAVIEGGPALALLEARLLATTAVALAAPMARPLPWPRDAGLVVVADPAAPAWVAALPSFTDA
jgi:hypothetical protein